MLDWSQCPAVERIPGKVSGERLFKRTRVPVKALFENLEDGARVNEFLEWFPCVTREQVELGASACGAQPDPSLSAPGYRRASMRILFDHGTPAPLHRALTVHSVSTAYQIS
jgi:uncharacterized protein (DUF433 family)